MSIACKICIMEKGLKGSETNRFFATEEQLFDHLEDEHDLVVRREGETEAEANARVHAKNKRIGTENCRCPECKAKRLTESVPAPIV